MFEATKLGNHSSLYNPFFKLIWRWQGPQHIRIHIWKLTNNALLTNARRCEKGMSISNVCPICRTHPKTILHMIILRAFGRVLFNLPTGISLVVHMCNFGSQITSVTIDLIVEVSLLCLVSSLNSFGGEEMSWFSLTNGN